MDDDYFDREARVTIECEMCGNEFQHSVRWIHTHDSVTCPQCGYSVDRDVCLRGIGQADQLAPGTHRDVPLTGPKQGT